ncbi:hypothetical protein GCM10025874_26370 [Arenivirga flava]|uniref:Cysteine--tRNA ligase n=1 Tax=Arenivirga flava TaxID=1930060 RepID=A0AA37XA45_9MICO|nr:hypothetical protein GCM10025874_26370 [Arenivirga flava]
MGLYVCGPTVQSAPHIGHLRSALVYDLWRRWFEHRGLAVTLVRNVTDIDDKVLANATADEPWWALAYRVEQRFDEAYDALGIRRPTYEPRATASIPEMIALIQRLVANGHAYAAGGDVYFDTASFPAYGALTRQRADDMEAAEDADPRGKRSPQDFALWKGRKPGEPDSAVWTTPWGPGRPGWHIECSAMSTRYLGPEFDIHGGGLDLRFPHHENELAQSHAAGDPFARHWLHNGLVSTGGQKMSKSLGNSFSAADLLAGTRPIVARYLLASAHYRSTLEFSEATLAEAASAFERVETFLQRAERMLGAVIAGEVPSAFGAAMDDDLGVPQALAELHGAVRSGNAALDAGRMDEARERAAETAAMLGALGLDPRDPAWAAGGAGPEAAALEALVRDLLEQRQAARAAKDYAGADGVRDRLAAAGITIEDTPSGAQWRIDG